MINKGDTVRIKAMEGIADYLHNLDGKVVRVKVEPIIKRTTKSNWNPVKVGTERVCTVDLRHHSNPDLDTSMSKKFQLPEGMLTKEN
jgi:hypothetical protein